MTARHLKPTKREPPATKATRRRGVRCLLHVGAGVSEVDWECGYGEEVGEERSKRMEELILQK